MLTAKEVQGALTLFPLAFNHAVVRFLNVSVDDIIRKMPLKGVFAMVKIEDKVREKLEAEAKLWVEEELEKRMVYAVKAINEQVAISADMCGPKKAQKHLQDAAALAEENIRQELEFEADEWVQSKLNERTKPLLEDHDLEGNLC